MVPGAGEMGPGDSWFTLSVCPRSPSDGHQGCCSIKQTSPAQSNGWTVSRATDAGNPCKGVILGMNTIQGPSHSMVIEHRGDDDAGIDEVNLLIVPDPGSFRAYYSCHRDANFGRVFVLDERKELVCRLAISI